MIKQSMLLQRMRLLQIASKEDSRIPKTKQNVLFLSCAVKNIVLLGSGDEICDLSRSILIADWSLKSGTQTPRSHIPCS